MEFKMMIIVNRIILPIFQNIVQNNFKVLNLYFYWHNKMKIYNGKKIYNIIKEEFIK